MTVNPKLLNSQFQNETVPLVRPSSCLEKVKRIWNFAYECIFKEFGSAVRHVWYRAVFWIHPNIYGLNRSIIPTVNKVNRTAKVILLMHGAGAHPSSFIPMAKQLSKAKINPIFTVNLKQSDQDPVPVNSLAARIKELISKYLAAGYKHVDFALVGHSLEALVAAKYIWPAIVGK